MVLIRFLLVLLLFAPLVSAQDGDRVPTIDDLLSIRSVGSPEISPDGSLVAYVANTTHFDQDAFVGQIWLASVDSGEAFQLTRGERSSTSPQWSPDGSWVAFVSRRDDDAAQIYAIRPDGGEAVQLTDAAGGVTSFAWAPDGRAMAFRSPEPQADVLARREEQTGDWFVVRREYRHTHLWTVDLADALRAPQRGVQRTSGQDFSVTAFEWSPDATRLAFSATINPDLINGSTSDIFVLDLAGDAVTKVVSLPGSDSGPHWSPDGEAIVFSTVMGEEPSYALNRQLAVVPAAGGPPRSVTSSFDESANFVAWTDRGIYFSGSQRTASHLFRVSAEGGRPIRLTGPDDAMTFQFSLTADGRSMAFLMASPTTVFDAHVSAVDDFAPRPLTDMTSELAALRLGSREVISWESRDGTEIEGVLIKPADFEGSVARPLLCVIHGGPTGINRPSLLSSGRRTYPIDIWVARGALVLHVNYRGSAGYGQAFRRLNTRNLGVGDAWDVLSGIDHLIDKGWVDPDRVGCMGWSQGGYISAFLTTSTDRFAAISVGAGISNWATYYYNTDITQFTLGYLGDDPVDDPDIYEKTSPMSYIESASTPTLIQHGEFDRRVPIPNAYELRQGLVDRGVPVEMVVYRGFGHGISTPKAQRAVMWHNLVWFNHHLWGDPLPSLATPEPWLDELDGDESDLGR